MSRPSSSPEIKKAIIRILKDRQKPKLDGKPGPGPGYNELFQEVRTKTHRPGMSTATYDKPLRELKNRHVVSITRDNRKKGRPVTVTLNSPEAEAELASLEVLEKIEEVFSSTQSLEEYGRIVQHVPPDGSGDAILSKQPFSKAMYRILRLIAIAHNCLARAYDPAFRDAFIQASATGPKVLEWSWRGREVVEENEKEAVLLEKVKTAAEENPKLKGLLGEIVPELYGNYRFKGPFGVDALKQRGRSRDVKA